MEILGIYQFFIKDRLKSGLLRLAKPSSNSFLLPPRKFIMPSRKLRFIMPSRKLKFIMPSRKLRFIMPSKKVRFIMSSLKVKILSRDALSLLSCEGGFPAEAWLFFQHEGIVSGGQYNTSQVTFYYLVPFQCLSNLTWSVCEILLSDSV